MQLFTTFGVQSSVPPKTVVAVISPEGEGSIDIDINAYYNADNNYPIVRVENINLNNALIDNSIYNKTSISIPNFVAWVLLVDDDSQTSTVYTRRTGETAPLGTTLSIPSSIDRISINFSNPGTTYWQVQPSTLQQQQDYLASEFPNIPQPQQVTFFDEYPNGTQIGNAVEITPPTAEYNLTFVDNSLFDEHSGIMYNTTGWARTDKLQIQNNSLIINTTNTFGLLHFWNDSTYLGFYHGSTATRYGPSGQNLSTWLGQITNTGAVSIPANATHFAFTIQKVTTSGLPAISFTTFQTLTASYLGGTTIVDPPATYKIRQLVFEG